MDQKIIRSNHLKYCLSTVFTSSALSIITGSIIQSFMAEIGIAEQSVTMFISILQLVQVVVMLLGSGYMDKVKNTIRAFSILVSACLPLFLVLTLFCYYNTASVSTKFWTILIVGIFTNIMISLYTPISYKLPYHVINMESYGPLTAFSGAALGICGVLISGLMTFGFERWDYFNVMKTVFLGGIVLLLTGVLITLRMKKINSYEREEHTDTKINLFLYKPFYILLLPNLFRGINAGFFSVIVMIGYYCNILDSTTSGYLVIITNIASILSCYLFGILSKRGARTENNVLLISSIGIALFMPAMLLGKSSTVFLIAYGIGYIFFSFVNNAVPVLLCRIVAYETMGRYTAYRMMTHTLGIAIAGFICIPMLDLFGGIITMIIAGLLQLFSGLAYYVIIKKKMYN